MVVSRLVDLLPQLEGWSEVTVYDGPPVTADNPDAYVTVGFVVGEDFAGSYEQTRNGDIQGLLEETGSVRSELVCLTGDVDLVSMRAQAFALVNTLEAEVSRDETLGVLSPATSSSLAVDVQPLQTTGGAEIRLVVTLSYVTRR